MLTFASLRKTTAAAGAGALLITGLAATPAHAGTSPSGELLMRGTGVLYAGSNDDVTSVAAPGATATFGITVKNNGSVSSRYRVVFNNPEFVVGTYTPTVSAGFNNVTTTAYSSAGYVTSLLSPGQVTALRLQVPYPTAPSINDFIEGAITLAPVDLPVVATNAWRVNLAAKTGTENMDAYTSDPTSRAVRADGFTSQAVAQTVKAGATASYTVRLQNDTTTATPLQIDLFTYPPGDRGFNQCTDSYAVVIKLGSHDITSAMRGDDGYITPSVAPHQSLTLAVAITTPASAPAGCLELDDIGAQAPYSGNPSSTLLVTNVAG